jgi:hypothetical protein
MFSFGDAFPQHKVAEMKERERKEPKERYLLESYDTQSESAPVRSFLVQIST